MGQGEDAAAGAKVTLYSDERTGHPIGRGAALKERDSPAKQPAGQSTWLMAMPRA